jgi:hypothetical protein
LWDGELRIRFLIGKLLIHGMMIGERWDFSRLEEGQINAVLRGK